MTRDFLKVWQLIRVVTGELPPFDLATALLYQFANKDLAQCKAKGNTQVYSKNIIIIWLLRF